MPRSSTAQKECFPCLTTIQTNVKYHKKVLNLPPVFLIYFFYSGNKKKKKKKGQKCQRNQQAMATFIFMWRQMSISQKSTASKTK